LGGLAYVRQYAHADMENRRLFCGAVGRYLVYYPIRTTNPTLWATHATNLHLYTCLAAGPAVTFCSEWECLRQHRQNFNEMVWTSQAIQHAIFVSLSHMRVDVLRWIPRQATNVTHLKYHTAVSRYNMHLASISVSQSDRSYILHSFVPPPRSIPRLRKQPLLAKRCHPPWCNRKLKQNQPTPYPLPKPTRHKGARRHCTRESVGLDGHRP